MSARHHAAIAAIALLAGCHAQPRTPAQGSQVQPERRIDDRIQEPWQRPAAWGEVEAMHGGRPGTVLAAREGGGVRLVENSSVGYTIREMSLDCKRGTMNLERAHGHVFGLAVPRRPDPISAIVTPAGIRTLCAASRSGVKLNPEDALEAVMAKQGVALPSLERSPQRGGRGPGNRQAEDAPP